MIAVNIPADGGTSLAIAIAIARGKATMATVRPESISAKKSSFLYPPLNESKSFGVNSLLFKNTIQTSIF